MHVDTSTIIGWIIIVGRGGSVHASVYLHDEFSVSLGFQQSDGVVRPPTPMGSGSNALSDSLGA